MRTLPPARAGGFLLGTMNRLSGSATRRPHRCRCCRDWCGPGGAAPGRGCRSRTRCSGSGAHRGARWQGGCSAAPLGAAGGGPYPQAIDLRPALGAQVSAGVAVAEVLAIGKGLASAHHLQVDVLAAPKNRGDSPAVTVGVHHLQGLFHAHGRLGGQLPAKSCSITLQLWLLAWPGSG